MDVARMGGAAIDEATESGPRRTGSFKSFLPNIYWRKDKEEKYLLFLTPINPIEEDEIAGSPQLDVIKIFEPKPDMVVAKTDPTIGERTDRFETTWDATPKLTNIAIAVELEPDMEVDSKGREKPKGFAVATRSFDRRIFEDEEDTGEVEEVTVPVIGTVAQSPGNFFSLLKHANDTEYTIEETALKVTRHGEDNNTAYSFHGFEDQEIDLTNLVDGLDGISYLGDTIDDLKSRIDGVEPKKAALIIGDHLLRKRVDEMLDPDVYDELFGEITKTMDKFGAKKAKAQKAATRPSQRRAVRKETQTDSTTEKLSKLKAKAQAAA